MLKFLRFSKFLFNKKFHGSIFEAIHLDVYIIMLAIIAVGSCSYPLLCSSQLATTPAFSLCLSFLFLGVATPLI